MNKLQCMASAVALALSAPLCGNASPLQAVEKDGAKHHGNVALEQSRHGHLARTATNAEKSHGHFPLNRDSAEDHHGMRSALAHPPHGVRSASGASGHNFDHHLSASANVNSNGRFAEHRYTGLERAAERHEMHDQRQAAGADRFARFRRDERFDRDRDDLIARHRDHRILRDRDDRRIADRDDYARKDRDDRYSRTRDKDDLIAASHGDRSRWDRDDRRVADRDDHIRKDGDDARVTRDRDDLAARDRDQGILRDRDRQRLADKDDYARRDSDDVSGVKTRTALADRDRQLAETRPQLAREPENRFAWNDRFTENTGGRFGSTRDERAALNNGQGTQASSLSNVNSNGRFAVDRETGLERTEERHEMNSRRQEATDDANGASAAAQSSGNQMRRDGDRLIKSGFSESTR